MGPAFKILDKIFPISGMIMSYKMLSTFYQILLLLDKIVPKSWKILKNFLLGRLYRGTAVWGLYRGTAVWGLYRGPTDSAVLL